MNRRQRDAVLLSLVQNLAKRGSWCGETHIQKAAYFLQQLARVPLGFEFILYKHGPFSFDLRDEVTALRADGILSLEPRPSPYGPSMLPGQNARLLSERFPQTLRRYQEHIQLVADELGNKNAAELERLGTALLVSLEQTCPRTIKARVKRVRALKPHFSGVEAGKAVRDVTAFQKRAAVLFAQRNAAS